MNEFITSAGKVIDVFNEAMARAPGAERAEFLDAACGADAGLRAEVEQLLGAHEEVGDFLNANTDEPLDSELQNAGFQPEQAGERIGRYKLLQQIGEGGFGTVWMAEQMEPVSRRVALKIIKPGMDTREVIARFEAERQALAMMDHPNIAKVFDAGATDKGRPFFVMELVKGTPITRYCDEAHLGTNERLSLFGDVCSAINHAHQKGIIHRDIKPSNVMVTMHGDKPVVKVIDFGIAKATQGKLTDKTLFTRFEQFIGTPVYMSPEQAATSGLDIDTRSDIYALGILLYELLTGKPPFDAKSLASAGYEEMRRIIREVEPLKPSTRLKELRTNSAVAKDTAEFQILNLKSKIPADLDWIVMKAIEKDRTRRYETANGLALDIQRFLADEPVSATPPGAAYRFRKFARRNKTALRVASGIAALLVAATAVSTWQAIRATQAEKKTASERDEKEAARKAAAEAEKLARERLAEVAAERDAKDRARKDAEAIATFLTEVFQSPDPERDGRTITVVKLLETAVKKLETSLTDQPGQRARLQSVLGMTYKAMGMFDKAIALEEKALEYHRTVSGPGHSDTLTAMGELAVSCVHAGRFDEAVRLQEEMMSRSKELLAGSSAKFSSSDQGPGGERSATVELMSRMTNLANIYHEAGRTDEAMKIYEDVLSRLVEEFGPEHLETVPVMHNLAYCYAGVGRNAEALAMQEEVLAIRRKLHPPEHPEILGAMHNLAMFYSTAGRKAEELTMNEEVLALRRKVLGPDHPDTLKTMGNLAASYSDAGRLNEALELQEKVVAGYRKLSGPEHPNTLLAIINLGVGHSRLGRLPEAHALEEEALVTMRRVLPPTHPFLAVALQNMAELCEKTGRGREALVLREELLAFHRRVSGPEHASTRDAIINLAHAYQIADRWDDATKQWEELLTLSRRLSGPEHPDTLGVMTDLAIARGRAGRLPEAVALQEQTLAIKRRVLPADHPFLAVALQHMSELHEQAGRTDEAAQLRAELAGLPAAKALITPIVPAPEPPAPTKKDLKALEENLDAVRNSKGPESPETIAAMTELAAACGADGSGRKAVKLGEEALALARRVLPAGAPQSAEVMRALIQIYRSVDLEADAAKLEAEISTPQAKQ